jgi:putative ABC transport system permease protein
MLNLKHLFRVFYKNPGTSVLVLISLSIGLAAYALINSRVAYHRSFDTHFRNYKNTYRVVSSTYTDGVLTISQPRTQRKLGETLEELYPEVTCSGFLCRPISNHFTIGEQVFTCDQAFHCSEDLAGMLSLKMVSGRATGLLSRPNVAILSESFARNHFGLEDPIGKTIQQYPGQNYEVEAVFEDVPGNSHFRPDVLISFHDNMHLPPPVKEDWGEFSFVTYLELADHTDLAQLEDRITRLLEAKNAKFIQQSQSEYRFRLQAVSDIHTRSRLKNEISRNVRGDYLNILQLVSIFILMISGFNYIYFTYMRLSENAIEYGIRRLSGAKRASFLLQFLVESCIIHLLALAMAVLLFLFINPLISGGNDLIGMEEMPMAFWLNMALIMLLSALLNPLILLHIFSKKSALTLLSGRDNGDPGSFSFRTLFTIAQFMIIVFLTSSALGMAKQIRYLDRMDKGMDIKDKLVIKTPAHIRRTSQRVIRLDAFENELNAISGVQSVSVSNNTPGEIPAFSFNASEQKEAHGIKIALFIADSAYMAAYGMDRVAGEGFSRSRPDACIINRTCMRQLGYGQPDEILQKTLYLNDESGLQSIECRVIGICEDFNFTGVKDLPDPIILMDWTAEMMWGKYTLALLPGADRQDILSQVEKQFTRTFPNFSFEYYWVEDFYNRQFEDENAILKALKAFGILSVILGFLSLISMVRHVSRARTKEIGIRKVHGADTLDIIRLLNRYFMSWIGGALVIGLSLSYVFLSSWLNSFAYREGTGVWVLLLSGGGIILLGTVTVVLQSLQAARRNPVMSLRYE